MGSIGANKNTAEYSRYNVDYSQGYKHASEILRNTYTNTEELRNAGFRSLNDFSLTALLKDTNEVASDYQPWNNKTVYFIWDPDFKTWQKAAERRYD